MWKIYLRWVLNYFSSEVKYRLKFSTYRFRWFKFDFWIIKKLMKLFQNLFKRRMWGNFYKLNFQPGINFIEVRFSSPVEYAKELASKQDIEYPVPPQCPPNDYRGECHINQLRKMQASFSWDWGPALASVGIWWVIFKFHIQGESLRYTYIWTIDS